jgi:SAM-dependent methyltransferase
MTKGRWCSLWHQAKLIADLKPRDVLEVGVGSGLLKVLCANMGVQYRSLDIDPELGPDVLAGVQRIPLGSGSVDLACAFQVLEHMPYEEALAGFRELCRVARKDVVISLPNAARVFPALLSLPFASALRFMIPVPGWPVGRMIPSHRWEIGRPGTELGRVIADLGAEARLVKSFRVFENPYHQFFHFSCC